MVIFHSCATCSPLGLQIAVHVINSLLLASFANIHVHVRSFTSLSLSERFFTSIGWISHPSAFGFYRHKTMVFVLYAMYVHIDLNQVYHMRTNKHHIHIS